MSNFKINSWPYYEQDEIDAASKVLKSGKVNSWNGDQTLLFQNEFAERLKVKYSVAIANGSLALSSCYLSCNLKPGDEVITTPRTFIATASSLILLKLKPVFADVDPNTGCITAQTIEPLINKRTKAIVVVHLGGWPADMNQINKLADKYQLKVVEDCAQAHGAKINGRSVGTFGDCAAWSFCTDKIISTAGEGGMVTTNDKNIWNLVWSLKDHGKSFNSVFKEKHPYGFRWLHEKFGSNFRLTEFQSVIGRIQLNKLDNWNKIRQRNASIISEKLSKCNLLRIPIPPSNITHAWYKYYCYLNLDQMKSDWSRDRIIREINENGYPAFHGGCSEIYLEKCFKNSKFKQSKRLPFAKLLGETSLMFNVHPTIDENMMENYSDIIQKIIIRASK